MRTKYLHNKVAIVSGSSMGIGKAIAKELCTRGARVVLNGRFTAKLNKTKREFEQEGYDVTAFVANIRCPNACRQLVDHAIQHFGSLDIVVNNAAVSGKGAVEETADKNFQVLIETNYTGSAYLSKYAIPHLKGNRGHIIFINSVGGMRGMPYNSAYTASKMAQAALAQALRIELCADRIHVGLVYVGFTVNDPNKKILDVDGTWVALPKRTNVKLDTPLQVARKVCNMIESRRNQLTLTPLGHFTRVMTQYFPRISGWLIKMGRKTIRDEYTFIRPAESVPEHFTSATSADHSATTSLPPSEAVRSVRQPSRHLSQT